TSEDVSAKIFVEVEKHHVCSPSSATTAAPSPRDDLTIQGDSSSAASTTSSSTSLLNTSV
ncbi:unnamed protein product, partial [Amoebophrya sp. A25]